MKKIRSYFSKVLGMFTVFAISFFVVGCKTPDDKIKITVAEVTHSVFYAPQYVAQELGFFEEEGLDVEIILTSGADKTMAALLSKDAQIGLMGPEASIFVYNNGATDYCVNFAQLTKRDGSFLMSRTKITNFTWDMLKGKEILGGRKGGVPEMTLEYVLKKNGLDVGQNDNTRDVNVRTDIAFAAMAGAYVSGEGDFVTIFEPTATLLEKEEKAYIIKSIGEESGEIPYTAYSSLKSYITNNPDVIEKFTRAIYKAQKWTKAHSAKEIAQTILPYFTDLSLDEAEIIMQRHIDIDAWMDVPYFNLEGFNRLMDVMEEAKELEKRAPFEKIVDNTYALKVMGK